jgi:hypothetical protein
MLHRPHKQGKQYGKKYRGDGYQRPSRIPPQVAPGYFQVFVHYSYY